MLFVYQLKTFGPRLVGNRPFEELERKLHNLMPR